MDVGAADPACRLMGRSRLTREECLASLAKYAEKHRTSHIRKAYAGLGDDCTLSRFVRVKRGFHPNVNRRQLKLPGVIRRKVFDDGRTIFHRKGVKSPRELKNVLVSAHGNAKIGRDVRKGRLFRGYHIFTLSLEERATCPRTCHHWETCYGNGMPYASRVDHRDQAALEHAIERDIVRELGRRNRAGILVRLHVLGDFFATSYVVFWARMLATYPGLAVYGYTARTSGTAIGWQINEVKKAFGQRFAVRWSDGGQRKDCTVSIKTPDQCPPGAFVCPEQAIGLTAPTPKHPEGRPILCATCGLCWNSTRNVAFLEH